MKLMTKIKNIFSPKTELSAKDITVKLTDLYKKDLKDLYMYRLNFNSITIDENTKEAFQLNTPSSISEFYSFELSGHKPYNIAVARLAIPYNIAAKVSSEYDNAFIETVKASLIAQLSTNVPKSANITSSIKFGRNNDTFFTDMNDYAAIEIRAFVRFSMGT